MKIAIFGGSGFLGSHVADTLSESGHEVKICDIKKSPYIIPGQEMVICNVLDKDTVNDIVKGVDVVYNFAGVVDIAKAQKDPVFTVEQNIVGNTIILDACRGHNVKRFVYASSVYVYSKSGGFYRSTKQASELLIEDYNKIYGLDFTILRYGSLYGPRSGDDNWIYNMLKQAISEKKITREGDGEEIREYIHVKDAARMSVEVLEEEYKNQHVIISGTQQIKVKELLLMVKEILDGDVEIKYVDAGKDEHYEITPYSFTPRIAKRIMSKSYLDLGQGIVDMMENIHSKENIRSIG